MKYWIFILIFGLLLPKVTFAASNILINEFLIEPSQSVELINLSDESTDLSGWFIDDSGGSSYYTIPQNTVIQPNSCIVFYSDFNLNKSSSDTIRLFDNKAPPISTNSSIIDSFLYTSSLGPNISFNRVPDGGLTWASGAATLGQLNKSKNSCIFTPTPSVQETTPTAIPVKNYENIFISEVMVYPTGGEYEWVEIYNNNDFEVNIENWYIDDIENRGSSPKLFSLKIPAKTYGVVELSFSVFNNGGDSVRLLDQDKNLKDSFEYLESKQGMTLGRTDFNMDNFCIQKPSKESVNNSCEAKEPLTNLSPTKALTIKTPPLNNRQIESSTLRNLRAEIKDESILGESTEVIKRMKSQNRMTSNFSFLSFSYSFLTLCSVLVRMKLGY